MPWLQLKNAMCRITNAQLKFEQLGQGQSDRQKLNLMEKSLMWDACGFNLAVALVPSQGKNQQH